MFSVSFNKFVFSLNSTKKILYIFFSFSIPKIIPIKEQSIYNLVAFKKF